MDLLNLDEVGKESRYLEYKGEKHEVLPLSVAGFIEISKLTEKAQKGGLKTYEELEQGMKLISSSIPTLSKETIDAFSIEQVLAITNFINGVVEVDKPEEGEEAEAKEAPKAKSKKAGK